MAFSYEDSFSYKDYSESDAVKKKREELEANSTYTESDAVRLAREAMESHNSNKVADWTGGTYGQSVQDALNKINNREKFSYDLNGDALYQQYKDQYINQGRLAMQDVMGQASAMTGGYGNSYAATVGNQAYQASLQNLNNIVPELYQMALNQYNQEGQDLKDSFSMYQSLYNTEYGEYRDKVGDWNTEAARLSDAYNNERNFDYGQFSTERDYLSNAYNNERSYDYGVYSDDYDRAFKEYQQDVSEQQYEEQRRIQKRQGDQSATIAALRQQVLDTEAKYEGYLSPAMQQAANGEAVKKFQNSLIRENVFNVLGKTAIINGKRERFDNYTQYVDAMIDSWYSNGTPKKNLTIEEVEYLKGLYGID